MTFDWTIAVWLIGALLALTSFLRLSNARSKALHDKLQTWLTDEIKSLQQKRHLFEMVRKKRAELRIQQELQAAKAEEEIKKLEIAKLLNERESSKAA